MHNHFETIDQMLWRTLKQMHGNLTAVYRRGEESRTVHVVPETARPDSFGIEDQAFTATSRVFKVEKADLDDWLPKHGDTLEYDGKTYTVKKTSEANTFYQDIGNSKVMIRIIVAEPRR